MLLIRLSRSTASIKICTDFLFIREILNLIRNSSNLLRTEDFVHNALKPLNLFSEIHENYNFSLHRIKNA